MYKTHPNFCFSTMTELATQFVRRQHTQQKLKSVAQWFPLGRKKAFFHFFPLMVCKHRGKFLNSPYLWCEVCLLWDTFAKPVRNAFVSTISLFLPMYEKTALLLQLYFGAKGASGESLNLYFSWDIQLPRYTIVSELYPMDWIDLWRLATIWALNSALPVLSTHLPVLFSDKQSKTGGNMIQTWIDETIQTLS